MIMYDDDDDALFDWIWHLIDSNLPFSFTIICRPWNKATVGVTDHKAIILIRTNVQQQGCFNI